MRMIVTGSRYWSDVTAVAQAMAEHVDVSSPPSQSTLVVGDATGADEIAAKIADQWGMTVERHFANWERYGKVAGPRRNWEMVDSGADVCLAFPMGESLGTRGCMEMARIAGIPVFNYGDDHA